MCYIWKCHLINCNRNKLFIDLSFLYNTSLCVVQKPAAKMASRIGLTLTVWPWTVDDQKRKFSLKLKLLDRKKIEKNQDSNLISIPWWLWFNLMDKHYFEKTTNFRLKQEPMNKWIHINQRTCGDQNVSTAIEISSTISTAKWSKAHSVHCSENGIVGPWLARTHWNTTRMFDHARFMRPKASRCQN